MADGKSSEAKPKKKKGYSTTAMVINTLISGGVGFLSAVGLGSFTNSIRTPEEIDAARKAKELEAKKAGG